MNNVQCFRAQRTEKGIFREADLTGFAAIESPVFHMLQRLLIKKQEILVAPLTLKKQELLVNHARGLVALVFLVHYTYSPESSEIVKCIDPEVLPDI